MNPSLKDVLYLLHALIPQPEVSGQLVGVGPLLPPYGFPESNSGQQTALPAKPLTSPR